MLRRHFLSALPAVAAAPPKRPNLIFISSDDHHWQCLGANGNPHIRTPHLDSLASQGVNFTNGTISTPQCCPSRGVLLSGLETYQSGLLSNGATALRKDHGPTVVEQLRGSGYETTLIGKWHIATPPSECGFVKAPLWMPGGASEYRDPPALSRGLGGGPGRVEGHITDLWADSAVDYLKSATQSFLLWLTFNAPHTPWFAAPKYRALYEGKDPTELAAPAHPPGGQKFDWLTYYAVISHLDDAVGRVAAQLKSSGLWDNSLVVFLGDNGYMCGTKNRTGKVVPWEESIRVPYFITGGVVKKRAALDMPTSSVDLPATLLDYGGVKPAYPLAGRSLRKVLETARPDRDAAFVTWPDGRLGAMAGNQQVEPYRLVRTRRLKLIRWESGKEELYDHSADGAETRNLIAAPEHAKLRGDLAARLRTYMRRTNDPALAWKS